MGWDDVHEIEKPFVVRVYHMRHLILRLCAFFSVCGMVLGLWMGEDEGHDIADSVIGMPCCGCGSGWVEVTEGKKEIFLLTLR